MKSCDAAGCNEKKIKMERIRCAINTYRNTILFISTIEFICVLSKYDKPGEWDPFFPYTILYINLFLLGTRSGVIFKLAIVSETHTEIIIYDWSFTEFGVQ